MRSGMYALMRSKSLVPLCCVWSVLQNARRSCFSLRVHRYDVPCLEGAMVILLLFLQERDRMDMGHEEAQKKRLLTLSRLPRLSWFAWSAGLTRDLSTP